MKILFIFLGVLLGEVGFAQVATNTSNQANAEAISLIEKLQKDLQMAPAASTLDCASNPSEKCDFMLVCNKLRANRNAAALYQNKNGEFIPNYKLFSLQQSVDQCRSSISNKDAAAKMGDFKTSQNKYLLRRKAFLDSVSSRHEEATMIKLEQTMLDTSLENSNGATGMMMGRAQIEKNIKDAESRAGIKLSDESRTKWIDSLDMTSGLDLNTQNNASAANPFMDPNLLNSTKAAGSREKMMAYRAQVQKQVDRSYDVFQDTKSQLIAVLNKRKNGKNNKEVENLVDRINKIKMNPPDVQQGGICGSPNAFYNPTDHSFTLCPQLLQMPSASIQAIVAHELGHSIDPCTSTFALEKIDGTLKPNPYASLIAQDTPEYSIFKATLPAQSSEKYAAMDRDFLKSSLSMVYEKFSFQNTQPAISSSQNPFSSVVSCLQGADSVEARVADIAGTKEAINKKINDLKQSGATDTDPRVKDLQETLARVDSVYADKKACSFIGSSGGQSQMQEAFSDWIASEVMANKITSAKTPEEGQQIAFEANGFFGAVNCEGFNADIAESARQTMEKAGCRHRGDTMSKDLQNMATHDDPHPEGYSRINRIFMANPAASRALGCQQQSGVKHCE